MKHCSRCDQDKELSEFHSDKNRRDGKGIYCKICSGKITSAYSKKHSKEIQAKATRYRVKNRHAILWYAAKKRAKRKGLEFTITKADIVIPASCPVFGIPIIVEAIGTPNDNSPSLDRIDNTKGYTKDNIVVVVSYRANSIKRDSSLEELQKLVEFYSKLQKTS